MLFLSMIPFSSGCFEPARWWFCLMTHDRKSGQLVLLSYFACIFNNQASAQCKQMAPQNITGAGGGNEEQF